MQYDDAASVPLFSLVYILAAWLQLVVQTVYLHQVKGCTK